jgi:hypothetical protein
MTSYLNDTTIWKSYFMIKYIWNFILMKCIVTRYFDLHTIWIMFRLTKCLKFHNMESMPNWWEHMDDFNIGKRIVLQIDKYYTCRCIVFIQVVDIIISYSLLEIQSEYLYLWGFEFIWCIQKILEMKKEL